MSTDREIFVSVDIETAGPIPGVYSMLAIGACIVDDPGKTFYLTLKPLDRNADPKALAVSGFSLSDLEASGEVPVAAIQRFDQWLSEVLVPGDQPVFVGFNAAFDWSFVNYYFHRFLGRNPFGFAALDIKSYYMGAANSSWAETRSSRMSKKLGVVGAGDHNALNDALFQAELFRRIATREAS